MASKKLMLIYPADEKEFYEGLIDKFGPGIEVKESCRTIQRAQEIIEGAVKNDGREPFDLYVFDLSTPEKMVGERVGYDTEEFNLNFIEDIRNKLNIENEIIAIIFSYSKFDYSIFQKFQNLNCTVFERKHRYMDEIASYIIHGSRRDKPLTISFKINENDKWEYSIIHPLGPKRTGSLNDSPKKIIEDILTTPIESIIKDQTNWKGVFDELGSKLNTMLFGETRFKVHFDETLKQFEQNQELSNLIKKTRVVLYTGPDLYQIAFESLKKPIEISTLPYPYWSLNDSFIKSIDDRNQNQDRQKDILEFSKPPYNFLIIDASFTIKTDSTESKKFHLSDEERHNIVEECNGIVKKLESKKKRSSIIGKIKRLPDKNSSRYANLWEQLEELKDKDEGPWHVVHYSGFTDYDATSKKGALFFPRITTSNSVSMKEEIRRIPDMRFRLELKRWHTNLVFFSGFQEANASIAFSMVPYGVPVAIGFLCEVKRSSAKKFAIELYDRLIEDNFDYETAFLESRVTMYTENEEDRIWISPTLVMADSFLSGISGDQSKEPVLLPRPRTIKVFFSYSHKDDDLRSKLITHLASLKNQGLIEEWHDRRIGAGDEWARQIDDHLESSQIILLLISSDFLASKYCRDVEMKQALKRHKAKEARVIPIILRPVDWQGELFGSLQALPKDANPVTQWSNQDEAFADIAKEIRKVVEELRGKS